MESLILKNGFVVDPINNVLGIHDLGIYEGKIDSIKENIDPDLSSEVIDLNGKIVMPGHIDTHAHLSSIGGDTWGEDRSYGHKMIAESGTTTVLDLAGNPLLMIEGMKKRGAGLNVACIEKF